MKLLTVFIGSFLIGFMSPEFGVASIELTPKNTVDKPAKTDANSFYKEEIEKLYQMAEAFTEQNKQSRILAKSALNSHFH
jgi:hypothetical protein